MYSFYALKFFRLSSILRSSVSGLVVTQPQPILMVHKAIYDHCCF